MRRVLTHSKPDGDAIAAAWLAETYLFPGEEVEVVFIARPRTGQPVPAADCVVDIAGVHDPRRLVFDHKPRPSPTGTRPAPRGSSGSTCSRSAGPSNTSKSWSASSTKETAARPGGRRWSWLAAGPGIRCPVRHARTSSKLDRAIARGWPLQRAERSPTLG